MLIMFKRILLLLVVIVAVWFGWQYYKGSLSQKEGVSTLPDLTGRVIIKQSGGKLGELTDVLGAATSRVFSSGLDLLNGVTGDAAEPVINSAVLDLKERVKSLPAEQYEKVKYEFCKDVIDDAKEGEI